jgi:hypothetical protein
MRPNSVAVGSCAKQESNTVQKITKKRIVFTGETSKICDLFE